MQLNDARVAIMAAMECNDYSRAECLLVEYEFCYPEFGAQLRDEVREAYDDVLGI